MKFSIIAAAAALVSSAVAKPTFGCVSMKQAQQLVSRYAAMQSRTDSDLGNVNQTGIAILTKDYQEISDSILSLDQSAPLGSVTFNGRSAYLSALAQSPGAKTGINTLGVYVASCSKVLWQWEFTNVGTGQYPVKGFNLFTLNRKNQIAQTELEFNSIAWGQDTYQLPCSGGETSGSYPAGGPPSAASAAAGGPPAATGSPAAAPTA